MVVIDATVLMLLIHPDAPAPIDEATGQPVAKCKERIEFLLATLSKDGSRVLVPTPVLSEVLVRAGDALPKILRVINTSSSLKIEAFDQRAAIEVALLTDGELKAGKHLDDTATKAKVKYDRQIIAIARVNGVKTIYSDDKTLGKVAVRNGLTVIRTGDLPLPPVAAQGSLPLGGPEVGTW